jgi:uncharacterized protein YegJ (DUF2314 family)
MTRPILFALASLAAFSPPPAHAETLAQKANRDGVLFAKKGDAEMNAAFAKAQSTLPTFIEALDGKIPAARGFTVKIPVTGDGQTEYFWVNEISHKGNQFTGRINNRPELVGNVTFGQKLTFQSARIRDWGYYFDGKLQGNFTTCVLLGRENAQEAEELKEQIGLSCP